MCGGVHDVIAGNKFHQNRSRGCRATGVRKSGSPIDLACRPYNSSALPCWLWCNTRQFNIENCDLGLWFVGFCGFDLRTWSRQCRDELARQISFTFIPVYSNKGKRLTQNKNDKRGIKY